jgi:hypothetical protein
MARLRVDCVVQGPANYSPHERVRAIGGTLSSGIRWEKTEQQAIADIKTGANSFVVSCGDGEVDIVIGVRGLRAYLKAATDDYVPQTLLDLPDCSAR